MKIVVKNLTFKCIIGLLKKERIKKQKVILNVYLHVSDDDFVDYSEVAKVVKKTYKNEKYFKVEESLLEISDILKKTFPKILKSKIKIIKPNILKDCLVGAVLKKKY